MKEVNARHAKAPDPDITFGDFLEGIALPFYRVEVEAFHGIHHARTASVIICSLNLARQKLTGLALKRLAGFLSSKAATFSRSVVAHLRWDLRAIFKLAVAEGYIDARPDLRPLHPERGEGRGQRAS